MNDDAPPLPDLLSSREPQPPTNARVLLAAELQTNVKFPQSLDVKQAAYFDALRLFVVGIAASRAQTADPIPLTEPNDECIAEYVHRAAEALLDASALMRGALHHIDGLKVAERDHARMLLNPLMQGLASALIGFGQYGVMAQASPPEGT